MSDAGQADLTDPNKSGLVRSIIVIIDGSEADPVTQSVSGGEGHRFKDSLAEV